MRSLIFAAVAASSLVPHVHYELKMALINQATHEPAAVGRINHIDYPDKASCAADGDVFVRKLLEQISKGLKPPAGYQIAVACMRVGPEEISVKR